MTSSYCVKRVRTGFGMRNINDLGYSDDIIVYLARGPGAWYHVSIAKTDLVYIRLQPTGFSFK